MISNVQLQPALDCAWFVEQRSNPIIHFQVMITGVGPTLGILMTVVRYFHGECFLCSLCQGLNVRRMFKFERCRARSNP